MLLEAQICDIWGEPVAGATIHHTKEGGGLQVHDPLNESRTARLTLSVYDRAAKYVRPLDRVLSVTYGPFLIFKGAILQCPTDYAAGTVDIYAHDPTIKLKHHYHRFGDMAVDLGYPLDGKGLRILVESAIPIEPQVDRGVPGNHILWGDDTSTQQGPRPTGNPPPEGAGIWRRVERGTNVWESVLNASQTLIGPDFRFRPVDEDHPGTGGVPDPGFFCELDTADRLGQDRTSECVFEHGLGQDSAENVIHEPDGDLVRNWWRQVYPGGERSRNDGGRTAVAQHNGSMADYGLMQGWESSGQPDSQQVLKEKAKAWVKAYHRPPDFFTVVPRISRGGVPRYGFDYKVGDTIRARARKGNRSTDLIGRIISATIAATDQAGNNRVVLDCVPSITVGFDETEEELLD